jgi:phage gp36-like protein
MAGYTLNDAWCSVQDVRNQNPLFTIAIIEDDKVNEFIDDAVELIRSKLRQRYDLTRFNIPLPDDLKQIRLLCARLACYKMASTRPDVVANPEMATFLWNLAIKKAPCGGKISD